MVRPAPLSKESILGLLNYAEQGQDLDLSDESKREINEFRVLRMLQLVVCNARVPIELADSQQGGRTCDHTDFFEPDSPTSRPSASSCGCTSPPTWLPARDGRLYVIGKGSMYTKGKSGPILVTNIEDDNLGSFGWKSYEESVADACFMWVADGDPTRR